jgi:hypothetical protein
MLSTHVYNAISSVDISTATEQFYIASRWLPTVATSTKMDLGQSEPLMKLPISLEQDSLRYDSSVLIDSIAPLCCASQKSLNRNGLVGEYTRGPKIVVHHVNGQRRTIPFSPTILFVSQKSFLDLRFHVLPHLRCVILFWVTNNERVECVYLTL